MNIISIFLLILIILCGLYMIFDSIYKSNCLNIQKLELIEKYILEYIGEFSTQVLSIDLNILTKEWIKNNTEYNTSEVFDFSKMNLSKDTLSILENLQDNRIEFIKDKITSVFVIHDKYNTSQFSTYFYITICREKNNKNIESIQICKIDSKDKKQVSIDIHSDNFGYSLNKQLKKFNYKDLEKVCNMFKKISTNDILDNEYFELGYFFLDQNVYNKDELLQLNITEICKNMRIVILGSEKRFIIVN
jgi:hypothetical protein